MRSYIIGTLLLALTAATTAACEESVKPCDQYDTFAEVATTSCPGLAWDCEAEYPLLTAPEQQDLDWCLDCVRLVLEGDDELDCSAAPLSGAECGALLDTTLDASCFAP